MHKSLVKSENNDSSSWGFDGTTSHVSKNALVATNEERRTLATGRRIPPLSLSPFPVFPDLKVFCMYS